mmetsp:Transcript_8958/g.24984  ORF Transcript_8958/g.24984 Transcript_8958/m.24984 type:complete len:203 (+) Transcript_8958:86-694(+)
MSCALNLTPSPQAAKCKRGTVQRQKLREGRQSLPEFSVSDDVLQEIKKLKDLDVRNVGCCSEEEGAHNKRLPSRRVSPQQPLRVIERRHQLAHITVAEVEIQYRCPSILGRRPHMRNQILVLRIAGVQVVFGPQVLGGRKTLNQIQAVNLYNGNLSVRQHARLSQCHKILLLTDGNVFEFDSRCRQNVPVELSPSTPSEVGD